MVDRTGGTFFGPNDYRRSSEGMASWIYELIQLATVATRAIRNALSTEELERTRADLQARQDAGKPLGVRTPDHKGETYEIAVLPAVEYVLQQRKAEPKNYSPDAIALHMVLTVTVEQLGDAIKYLGFANRYPKNEAIQFLFHLRNAFAHGGVFTFYNRVNFDKKPAKANGLSLDLSMNGKPLWSIVAPGDIYALLDELLRFFGDESRG